MPDVKKLQSEGFEPWDVREPDGVRLADPWEWAAMGDMLKPEQRRWKGRERAESFDGDLREPQPARRRERAYSEGDCEEAAREFVALGENLEYQQVKGRTPEQKMLDRFLKAIHEGFKGTGKGGRPTLGLDVSDVLGRIDQVQDIPKDWVNKSVSMKAAVEGRVAAEGRPLGWSPLTKAQAELVHDVAVSFLMRQRPRQQELCPQCARVVWGEDRAYVTYAHWPAAHHHRTHDCLGIIDWKKESSLDRLTCATVTEDPRVERFVASRICPPRLEACTVNLARVHHVAGKSWQDTYDPTMDYAETDYFGFPMILAGQTRMGYYDWGSDLTIIGTEVVAKLPAKEVEVVQENVPIRFSVADKSAGTVKHTCRILKLRIQRTDQVGPGLIVEAIELPKGTAPTAGLLVGRRTAIGHRMYTAHFEGRPVLVWGNQGAVPFLTKTEAHDLEQGEGKAAEAR